MRNTRGTDCRGWQVCTYVPAAGGKIQGVKSRGIYMRGFRNICEVSGVFVKASGYLALAFASWIW